MKHKSFAPWLVALVCSRPVRGGAIHLLRAARALVAAAASGQPRAAARARAVAAAGRRGVCRRGGRGASRVAIDLCKNEPVRAAMRAAPGPAATGAIGARPRLRIACSESSGTSAAFRSSTIRELVAHALDDAARPRHRRGARRRALGVAAACTWPIRVGWSILSYPPDVEQKELLRDLKRLLAGSDS